MKPPQKASDRHCVATQAAAKLHPSRSIADQLTALQEAADEIGLVDHSFDQKKFFDAL